MPNRYEAMVSIHQYELMKSFLEHTTDGIAVVDLNGRVVDVNRAFEALHGWKRSELIGRLLPVTPHHLRPEAMELVEEAQEGRRVSRLETYRLKKDGTLFPVSLTISPIKDEAGNVVALIGIERDISVQKMAETKLRESEDRFRRLVDNLPEPILVVTDFEVVYANPASHRMIGSEERDLLKGSCILDFIHPSFVTEVAGRLRETLDSDKPSELLPVKLVRPDGVTLDVEVKLVPVHCSERTSVQMLFRDISQWKIAEESLQEAEYLYQCLVENALVGVYLVQDDNIVYVNPYLAASHGYTQEEMMKLGVEELVAEEDLQPFVDKARDVLAGRISGFQYAVNGLRKDGSAGRYEGNLSYIVYKGKPALLGTVQDVAYKKEIKDAVYENAQRYQRLIKFLPEPIVVSSEGTIVYANKSAMKLLRTQNDNDLVGKSIFDFIHPDHHEESRKVVRAVMETDESSPFVERKLICCDGQIIEVELSSIRIHNYMGNMVTLSVMRDITERKKSEELLIRSEKLSVVGQLAAGLAHEIRNPLTSLKGFNQLLKSRNRDQASYFDLMLTELERINLIVNDFMTLAKPQMSRFSNGDIVRILENVLSVLSHQAVLMNVNLSLHAEEGLPAIYCDDNQLKQVFINIIKNAIESMPCGGNVSVSVQADRETDKLCVRVADEGEGMPEAIVQKLGEPFLTTKSSGTGLGLMISYRIIENHHGSLSFRSVRNEGTVAEISLPCVTAS